MTTERREEWTCVMAHHGPWCDARCAESVALDAVRNVATRYEPTGQRGGCGDGPALLSLADRIALVEAGRELTASRPSPAERDREALAEAIAIANERVGPRSNVTLHDYTGGVHQDDTCRWCRIASRVSGASE